MWMMRPGGYSGWWTDWDRVLFTSRSGSEGDCSCSGWQHGKLELMVLHCKYKWITQNYNWRYWTWQGFQLKRNYKPNNFVTTPLSKLHKVISYLGMLSLMQCLCQLMPQPFQLMKTNSGHNVLANNYAGDEVLTGNHCILTEIIICFIT